MYYAPYIVRGVQFTNNYTPTYRRRSEHKYMYYAPYIVRDVHFTDNYTPTYRRRSEHKEPTQAA